MNSFELLKAYFKQEKHSFTGDVKAEIAKHNRQSLAPYLYYVYGDKFLNVYLGATLIQEKFYQLQRELTKLFNENKIAHFYIKGSVLSKLYPDTALRTRGDIDVMVKDSDYERAHKLLLENGYEFESECDHHKGFYKNNLEVELHHRLCDESDPYYYYFKDAFNHTNLIEGSLYELDINYHYIFLIYHLNRHLKYGEGLRSFLDFYYLDKKYKLDYEYILKELDKLGFKKLYYSIIGCIYEITGTKLYDYKDIDVMPLIESLLKTGIHGKMEGNYLSVERNITKKGSKLKYLISTITMDKDNRKRLYPFMSKHYILYPFMWIHRFFYLLFNRSNKLKKVIDVNKKDAKAKIDFYESYGIVDKE